MNSTCFWTPLAIGGPSSSNSMTSQILPVGQIAKASEQMNIAIKLILTREFVKQDTETAVIP